MLFSINQCLQNGKKKPWIGHGGLDVNLGNERKHSQERGMLIQDSVKWQGHICAVGRLKQASSETTEKGGREEINVHPSWVSKLLMRQGVGQNPQTVLNASAKLYEFMKFVNCISIWSLVPGTTEFGVMLIPLSHRLLWAFNEITHVGKGVQFLD